MDGARPIECVIMIGLPAAGKSTLARSVLAVSVQPDGSVA
jgi:hypothetical protein